jgi:hypothetical protein
MNYFSNYSLTASTHKPILYKCGIESDSAIPAHSEARFQQQCSCTTFSRGVVMSQFWLKRVVFSAAVLLIGAIAAVAVPVVAPPAAPVLKSPANGVGGQNILEKLSWNAATGATSYEVQASTVSDFSTTFFDQTGGSTASSLFLQNLSPSTVYYWHAQAINAGGPSGWSGGWSFTTFHYVFDTVTGSNMSIGVPLSVHPTIDGVPLGLYDEIGVFNKAGQCYGGQCVWDSVSGKNITAVGQDIYQPSPDGFNAGDSMYFRVWDYSAQKEVLAAVTFSSGGAVYSDGGAAYLATLTAVSTPDQPVLAAPANSATGQPVSISLSWNSAARASSYALQVSTSSAFSSTVLSQSGITAPLRAITGLGYPVTYFWKVMATNVANASSIWSGVWSFTTGIPAPALVSPSNGAAGQLAALSLTWGAVAGATSYGVQVSTVSAFGSTVSSQTVTAATAAVSGLPFGGTYYWHVDAVIGGSASAWSSAWNFATMALPGTPVLSAPSNGAALQVGKTSSLTLSWGSAATAASYTLQVSTTSAFSTSFVNQAGLTALSAVVANWPASGAYYWRVGAINAAGTVWSTIWTINLSVPVLSGPIAASKALTLAFRAGSLCYSLPAASRIEITVSDILGRTALAISRSESAGSHSMNLNTSSLAPGRYIARLKGGAMEKQVSFFLDR